MSGAEDTNKIMIELIQKVSRVETLLEGIVDHQFFARERNDIRRETHHIVADSQRQQEEMLSARMDVKIGAVKDEGEEYTDSQIKELRAELAERQEREEKVAADVRRTFALSAIVGTGGILYALYQLFSQAMVGAN